MSLVYHMRSDDELHLGMRIKIRNEYILIGCPRTTCHECAAVISLEAFHQRQFLSLTTDIKHSVKTSVSHYSGICYSNSLKQIHRFLILHKQVFKAFKHIGISCQTTVPTEKDLSGTEYRRNAIHGYSLLLQLR